LNSVIITKEIFRGLIARIKKKKYKEEKFCLNKYWIFILKIPIFVDNEL